MFLPIPQLTTPKAPNPINVQLKKSQRLHPTPIVPMQAKKLLFGHLPEVVSNVEAEDLVNNEVEDGGASEDDEVDMFIQVGVEYGPSIKLIIGYISEPSFDEEDIDFMHNPKNNDNDNDNDDEVHDLVDEQFDLDGDNIDEDDDITSFVKLSKNLHMYKNFKKYFKGDYLQSLSWGAAKEYKVQPENYVDPPPLERHPGKPRKQRIRVDDEEKATRNRKCNKCHEPGHNRRTCPLGKGEGRKSKKSKQSTETNEDNEANEVEPQNVDNSEGEPQVKNMDNNESEPEVNDIPRATRGGGSRGGGRRATRGGTTGGRVGGTTETANVQTENPRGYSTRSVIGRGGGRGLGWWLGEDS
ncbi:hypothetical protein IFM89_036542 [Coptis chinensis]|uniref:CCHC-type domain-containing protein n=1 Tax=Coptis chinensis TaxID=261450 RepID=A0A835IX02_9MAGN|nr:hypothetical protein IFM89_036542 [Coptis chinensis]